MKMRSTLALCVALAALAAAQEHSSTGEPSTHGSGGPSGSGGAPVSHGPPAKVVKMYTAHAILACLAWAFIFPLGGIMIRLLSFPGLLWVHAGLQIFGYCVYIAAIGLGVQLSINPKFWRLGNKHAIIGLLIFILFAGQACTGYIHHLFFKRVMKRTTWSYVHLWTGRVCVTLGIINAGFGFEITHKKLDSWPVTTYTVCAVLVWVTYVLAIVFGEMGRRKKGKQTTEVRRESDDSSESVGSQKVEEKSMAAKINSDIPSHMIDG